MTILSLMWSLDRSIPSCVTIVSDVVRYVAPAVVTDVSILCLMWSLYRWRCQKWQKAVGHQKAETSVQASKLPTFFLVTLLDLFFVCFFFRSLTFFFQRGNMGKVLAKGKCPWLFCLFHAFFLPWKTSFFLPPSLFFSLWCVTILWEATLLIICFFSVENVLILWDLCHHVFLVAIDNSFFF